MSVFRRTFTTFFSKVDQVVGEIENHDALIKAAISEQRRKISTAKVELARVKQHEEKVKEQIQQLDQNKILWSQRAIKEAAVDEEKALACMQQREAVEEQGAKLNGVLRQYTKAAEKMKQDLKRGDSELVELTQKYQIMRARQSTADALNNRGNKWGVDLDELDTSFDRWEVKISQGEYSLDNDIIDVEIDNLEQVYIREENEQHLKNQLARLLEEGKIDE
jgi:phage shock protein A